MTQERAIELLRNLAGELANQFEVSGAEHLMKLNGFTDEEIEELWDDAEC